MLFIYLAAFLFFYNITNAKSKPLFRFVLSLYLFSICCAIFLWYAYPGPTRQYNLSLPAILYHTFYILVMMIPLASFDKKVKIENLSLSYNRIKPYCIILILMSVASIIGSLLCYYEIFKSGISIADGRVGAFAGDNFRLIYKPNGSLLAHASAIASGLCFVILFLAFYIKSFFPERKKMFIWMMISSTVAIFYQLEWFGRENIVRYFFDFVLIYIIFKDVLGDSVRKKIKRYSSIIFILAGIAFLAITLSRFDMELYEEGPLYSLISYAGQGFYYFSPHFDYYGPHYGDGHTLFAFLYPENLRGSIYNQASNATVYADIPYNVFSTYVGSFVNSFGAVYACIFALVFIVFERYVLTVKSDNPAFYIYILFILRFFASGIFYWIDIWANGDIVFCFFIMFVIDFFHKHKIVTR